MIIKKARAIKGRVQRLNRLIEKCKNLNCPIARKLSHEVDMIEKAASGIVEEVGK